MLNRQFRLRDRQSVSRVYRSGKTSRVDSLSIRYLNNKQPQTRIAVVVSKKVSKTAPSRNRIRRRIYESLRRRWPEIKPGFDVIISVFDEQTKSVPQTKLDEQITQLLSKSGLSVS